MSVRSRVLAASAVALTAAVTIGAAALPTAAYADTAVPAPAHPLTLTVGAQTPNRVLVPGGAAESFLVKVVNNSAKAQTFSPSFGAGPKGVVPVTSRDVAVSVAPVGHTPAASSTVLTNGFGVLGGFYPKGAKFGSSFSVPAHATYEWKVSLAATKAWPLNDSNLGLGVYDNSNHSDVVSDYVYFQVGNGHTGGPVNETLTGGTGVAPGHPAYETLTITNRTGAELFDWCTNAAVYGSQTTFGVDVLIGHTWMNLAHLSGGPLCRTELPENGTQRYQLRVQLLSDKSTAASEQATLVAWGAVGDYNDYNAMTASSAAGEHLTVYRKA